MVTAVIVPASAARAQAAAFDLQAHAGGRGQATGESLRAFAKSLELGVSTLELDINVTADGQPLVWHDPVIEPEQCSDTGPAFAGDPAYPYVGRAVHELTLAQIRTLDCGKPNPQFPDAEVVRGNKVAILPEVFALAESYHASGPDGIRYNIETKVAADRPELTASPQEFVDVILAAVRSAGQTGRVEIQSFDWRTLPLVRHAEPSIPLVALWDRQTWAPDSPWSAGINPATVGDPMVAAKLVGADILSPVSTLVNKDFVDRAHAWGFGVIPWTVDQVPAMREQIADGVDGLITNYPARLRGVLAELGMPLPRPYRRAP
ncbi:glycerophosphodiester phosphodiesterase [Mycobacterium parmense]|nr:glycerophosphodiester phosphodiesterase [Mycobacterium parmense]MCV7353068.1 glycerophosphodiester phosphodiesterase [Mycobacterium parmense]ORW55045.1 glycerophosphodiester phosphodiesterase [Mycobacterium parmense]